MTRLCQTLSFSPNRPWKVRAAGDDQRVLVDAGERPGEAEFVRNGR